MNTIAVIDFETTGLSPAMGDRATEIAIVLVQGDKVVDRYQSLMNAGVRVSGFIEQYTGITNAMLAAAPSADKVMADAARFVGGAPMVAHNAAFDKKFWMAELERLDVDSRNAFACTMLVSRRLYPQAPNHRLGSLVDYHRLPRFGQAHRAMADAEMAAALLGQIQQDMRSRYGLEDAGHELLMKVQSCARNAVAAMVKSHAAPARVSVKPAFTPVKSVGEARAATASHAAWARSVAEVVAPVSVAASPGRVPDGLTQGFANVASPATKSSGAPSTHVLRLSPGDDLRAGLVKAFADLSRTHGVTAGCVISSVGSLSRAVLRYAAEDRGTEIVAPLELITLSGTLSPDGVHLHASIADAQGRMTGGHLMPGCIVRTTAEVVLALLPEWEFGREVDAATGFKELVVRRVP
ncbi:MAG: DUF296 domain-containing protein [Massilia sp.]|nr:DUF296 domain-containing protein [Massilia sp.]